MRFADLLKGDRAGSEGIRAAIARAEDAARAASERLDALTAERARALVDDDDKALDRIEAETTRARRDLDRAELAVEELRRRLVEAEAAERKARLDETYERGLAAQRKAVGLIKGRYAKLALELRNLMVELRALDEQVAAAKVELGAALDPRQLVEPDREARPQPLEVAFYQQPIHELIRLPHPSNPLAYLHPALDLWGSPVAAAEEGNR